MKASLLMLCMVITYTQAACDKRRSYPEDQAKKDNVKEETPEQELSRKIREFQKERREAFLAGKPYKTTTYEIGFGKNSVPKKISEVLDTSAIIEKPKSSCNNKSIKINQKKKRGRRRRRTSSRKRSKRI